ncbi:Glucosyl-3-phosphoglycerate synthase [Folsomia candida]|uniref:Glucosyl-3-phosphoglycerate synthase n=1 Tax=Folsomia candida TaxID=158441 RepID=A0A226D2D1_FOLCA|nr:Glucosyl-3-phosphoglycerate synthase [Folsomia candida]
MSAFPETPLPDAPPPPEEAGDETLWEKLSAFIMPAVTLTLLVSAAFPLFDGAEILSDGDTWEAIRWHAYAPSSLPARFSVTNVTIRVDRVATKLIGTDLALNFVLVQEWEDERLVVKRKGKPGLPSGVSPHLHKSHYAHFRRCGPSVLNKFSRMRQIMQMR